MMENGFSSPRNDTFPAGLRVLVVDDDPTWLKILEKMLKKCSYEVTTCGLARDALKLLREKKDGYDIVISDVNMPDMDGFKLLEHVGLEMDLPVIMMSVDGETSRVMKGVQHGACDYLLKPIRLKELKNIWQHVLRKKIHEVRDAEILEGIENIQMTTTGSDQSDDGQLLFGDDLTSPKKRKDAENKYADKEPGDSSSMKKARVIWSVDLHQKFVKAVDLIGFDIPTYNVCWAEVGPKKILDLMNVPWLTRENVASHLQKYRLYLSRLQKENDLKQRAGVIKLSDSPSFESTASFEFQNQNNLQQKDTKISGYEFSGNTSLIQNEGPRSLESDRRGSVQMSVAEPRRVLDINVPSPHQPKSSLVEFGLSLTSPISEVNFVASDCTFATQYSWCDVSPVELKLENKPLRVGDNFSQPQRRHMQPAPQVISRISKTEREVGGSLNFKTSDEYGPSVNVVRSAWSYDNPRPVETNIWVPNHQATVPILHDALSMKIQGLNWDCTGEYGSPQKHVSLGVPPLVTLDENLPFCLAESDCFSTSIGVQGMEFSKESCCYPGINAEVPINLYADFEHEIHYDPADYAVLDQGLFIA